ncbi:6-phosphofructokinase [Gammaproteobacteria bacterium]|nr:6-phosphofructokinase [Gammaproteobacteria bacterium]MDA8924940.1 6-phosphofructokinase [Gammaproteobacteria bacterium]MDA9371072.1 6-phosphofructokinase [Gammaproteobacteria bacterium]MDB4210326.1 6-phosphofructokinase [Gammaproteobacteria bacterium]MDC1475679.1 6-phosphofructokinase [Gammaproteobacteria bacterium]|tara:strand:- start:7191 stop:8432 length:1242 start_codon:yes stop_codon:yes gene_type:complete
MKKNAFYAQSGGVTSVINASASAVILEAKKHPEIGRVFAGKNGILGALREDLIDTSKESRKFVEDLQFRPGGVFGSCRYKLKGINENLKEYQRLIEVFQAHNIGYFFYNGGNDSADTALKISQISKKLGYPLQCIAIPKTVDNDLAVTDCCPGFGSVAKYVATSTIEAALDVESMCETSTKVFVLEVMGRHAGWIAGSSILAQNSHPGAPHIILLPEVVFKQGEFLAKVKKTVADHGFCVIVASEGIKNSRGKFLAESSSKDAFGHSQLGGVAPRIAELIEKKLKLKNHWAVADYLQRSASHLSSGVDRKHAYEVGKKAVEYAVKGMNGVMPIIQRISDSPYQWKVVPAPLNKIANVEKKLPANFISKDGFSLTSKAKAYFQPLVEGDSDPKRTMSYKAGKMHMVQKKLKPWA